MEYEVVMMPSSEGENSVDGAVYLFARSSN